MKQFNLDIFKLSLTILLIWIAYSIHNFSHNGRYQYETGESIATILDTRTGTTYYIDLDRKAAKFSDGIE